MEQFLVFLMHSKQQILTFKFMQWKLMNLLFYLVKTWSSQIQGISAGFIPDTLDTKAYDGVVRVTSDDALALGREIWWKRRFPCRDFSAAAIYGAIEIPKIRYR